MAKASKGSRRIELWPGPFTATHALIAVSLMVNVALVALLIIIAKTDILDRQVASRGAEILCSEEYRGKISDKNAKALLDYTCVSDKAQSFFVEGYNKYRESINLAPIKD